MFIRLTPDISVAPQIAPADCAAARAQGFTAIVNNRPDGEAPGQPTAAEMRAAAEAAGLRYADIPVDHTGLGMAQVEAMAAELAAAGGPMLAFCRSGTRSTNLWALAAALRGEDPAAIIAAAEAGGYDVSGMLPTLQRLSGESPTLQRLSGESPTEQRPFGKA
ncbi:TIGR01244 family sulfur transferase [Sandarakinorhabdus sp. DWP1-3-1]|uniref:TIGR01244 family sulfur transferase n=1 Tax=Sandarakinorhabdus sp. DWP1-3-1 TaxID=2804627 RepID=UPI003CF3A225